MEEGMINCILGEKVRGLNISIENEEIKFNRKRERFELAELVETMRSLKMEVNSSKENKKLTPNLFFRKAHFFLSC